MKTSMESIDSTAIRSTIGKRIKSLRNQYGMSQEDLADRIKDILEQKYPEMNGGSKVKRLYVTRWEAGTSIPSTPLMACMTMIFKCSAAYLCGLENNPETIEHLNKELIKKDELPLYDGMPVVTSDGEYGLYNDSTKQITKLDGSFCCIEDVELFPADVIYANIYAPGAILSLDAAKTRNKVWIELISPEEKLKAAFRGWYTYNKNTLCFEGKSIFHQEDHGRTYVTMERSPFS